LVGGRDGRCDKYDTKMRGISFWIESLYHTYQNLHFIPNSTIGRPASARQECIDEFQHVVRMGLL
jgi:hypothetical protein